MTETLTSAPLEFHAVFCDGDNRITFRVGDRALLNFHNAAESPGWIAAQTARLSDLQVRAGFPPCILEVDDAIFVPGYRALYDAAGNRILQSCLRRGVGLSEIIDGPENIQIPRDLSVVDEPVVYLGPVDLHWGHFLTEGISRLWALDGPSTRKGRKLFFGNAASNSFHRQINEFLSAGGLASSIYRELPGPMKISKAIVPSPSFANRAQAYSAHTMFPRSIGASILAGGPQKSRSSRPVYLSRSRLSGVRLIRNEIEFENYLRSFGILVCYPETLSLIQQVLLFNTHSTFIGCWGSAFHNLVFCSQTEGCIIHVLTWDEYLNPNFFMFDAIVETESNYINCLRPTPGAEQAWPVLDLYIDIHLAQSYLRENRII